jgi:Spy/CpxP family protein refolding chaperone
MKRRTMMGLAVAGTVGVLSAAAAVAFGGGAGGFRHGMMKRMVTAAIDEALDEAQVTPEQRARIHAVRDRVFAAVETQRASRHAHLEEALRLFESDRPDPAALEALHRTAEAERAQVREAVHDALLEVHGILTPTQRRALADHVRAHRMAHAH